MRELCIDINGRSATLGVAQNQDVIPDEFKTQAFRIQQDVYMICEGKFYKTGVKVAGAQVNLDAWKNVNRCAVNNSVTVSYTFDKALISSPDH